MKKRNPMSIEKETETQLLLKILKDRGAIGMKYWRTDIPATIKESHYAIVTTWNNREDFNRSGAKVNNILATNGHLHDSILRYLNPKEI